MAVNNNNSGNNNPDNRFGENKPGHKPGHNASTFRSDTYFCQSCGSYLVENVPDCPSCRERIDWSRA